MTHTDPSVLRQQIEQAKEQVVLGGIYCHYKDPASRYEVIDIGLDEKTQTRCVIYRPLLPGYEGIVWIRPLDSFVGEVDVDGQLVPRFQLVTEDS